MTKNNMKNIRIAALLILLVAIFTALLFTFGLFENSTTRTTEAGVGDWVVSVNGTDITSHNTFGIDDIIFDSSSNVKPGKLAPGGAGYFNIIIDPRGSKVSVRYDVTYDLSELDNYDLTFEVSDAEGRALTKTGEYTYTGVIPLSEINNNVTSTIKCNIAWNNDESKNDDDSVVGMDKDASFEIPVEVKATQYLGEVITQYNESN